jgi:hypothetical protein
MPINRITPNIVAEANESQTEKQPIAEATPQIAPQGIAGQADVLEDASHGNQFSEMTSLRSVNAALNTQRQEVAVEELAVQQQFTSVERAEDKQKQIEIGQAQAALDQLNGELQGLPDNISEEILGWADRLESMVEDAMHTQPPDYARAEKAIHALNQMVETAAGLPLALADQASSDPEGQGDKSTPLLNTMDALKKIFEEATQ